MIDIPSGRGGYLVALAGALILALTLSLTLYDSALASELPDKGDLDKKIQSALLAQLEGNEAPVVGTPHRHASWQELQMRGPMLALDDADLGAHLALAEKDDTVQVIVEAVSVRAVDGVMSAIDGLGGRVELSVDDKVQAKVGREAIRTLAKREDVSFIRLPFRPDFAQGSVVSEGLEIIEAQSWHQAGFQGEAVKVGIIDSGFREFERLQGRELPPEGKVHAKSFRADGDIACTQCSRTGQVHGLAVAEIVHDIAPQASLFLANFSTDVEMEAAVDWMMEQGVEVINTSFGFLTTGCPYEGRGFLDPVFEEARENGILWAASAGNEAQRHWAGPYSNPDEDRFMNFTEDDESQTLINLEPGERVTAILWWSDPCRRAPHDYDLVLEGENGDEIGRSSRAGPRNSWPIEAVSVEVPERGTYHLKIEIVEGSADNKINLLMLNQRPQFVVPEGSAGLTEPEMSQFVVSVGATDLQNRIEPFSSRGPTPDERVKPDIAAPDRVSTRTFSQFGGTSASSPHVVGAAALVKSAFPEFGPEQVQQFLADRAEDFGPPGPDGQYGAGLLLMGAPPAQAEVPNAPSDLQASAIVPSRIDLAWRDNSEDEDGFLIERRLRSEPDEKFSELARVEADITRFSDTSVEPDTAYCYRLTAFNEQGASQPTGIACAQTPRENRPPKADAGADRTVFVGTRVTLDGSASSDPDGDALTFQWAFVEKPQTSSATIDDPASPAPEFVPDVSGSYVLQLTVADSQGATDSDRVRIEAVPTGKLVAVKFVRLEFLSPEAWERTHSEGCVIYRNTSDTAVVVRTTLPDGSTLEFEIPSGNTVIVCGDVAHIDARALAQQRQEQNSESLAKPKTGSSSEKFDEE